MSTTTVGDPDVDPRVDVGVEVRRVKASLRALAPEVVPERVPGHMLARLSRDLGCIERQAAGMRLVLCRSRALPGRGVPHRPRHSQHASHEALMADARYLLARDVLSDLDPDLADDLDPASVGDTGPTDQTSSTPDARGPAEPGPAAPCASRRRRLGPGPPGGGNRRAPAQINVHVDYHALRRGFANEGETCELVGIGPVPVALVRHMAADAILRVILTGDDVTVIGSHAVTSLPPCDVLSRHGTRSAWSPAATPATTSRSTTSTASPSAAPPHSTTSPASVDTTTTSRPTAAGPSPADPAAGS